jgi:hypothetical protein
MDTISLTDLNSDILSIVTKYIDIRDEFNLKLSSNKINNIIKSFRNNEDIFFITISNDKLKNLTINEYEGKIIYFLPFTRESLDNFIERFKKKYTYKDDNSLMIDEYFTLHLYQNDNLNEINGKIIKCIFTQINLYNFNKNVIFPYRVDTFYVNYYNCDINPILSRRTHTILYEKCNFFNSLWFQYVAYKTDTYYDEISLSFNECKFKFNNFNKKLINYDIKLTKCDISQQDFIDLFKFQNINDLCIIDCPNIKELPNMTMRYFTYYNYDIKKRQKNRHKVQLDLSQCLISSVNINDKTHYDTKFKYYCNTEAFNKDYPEYIYDNMEDKEIDINDSKLLENWDEFILPPSESDESDYEIDYLSDQEQDQNFYDYYDDI